MLTFLDYDPKCNILMRCRTYRMRSNIPEKSNWIRLDMLHWLRRKDVVPPERLFIWQPERPIMKMQASPKWRSEETRPLGHDHPARTTGRPWKHVNDRSTLCHHIGLALYIDDIAIVAMSKQPALMETYQGDLEIWLRGWRVAVNFDKRAAVFFSTTRIPTPRPRDKIQRVVKVKYLGATLDKRLTWVSHIDQATRRASQRFRVLGPLLNNCSGLYIRNGLMQYKQVTCPIKNHDCPVWSHSEDCNWLSIIYNCTRNWSFFIESKAQCFLLKFLIRRTL